MTRGKFILFFQAITTLIIGIIFFVQVFSIQHTIETHVEETTLKSGINSVTVQNDVVKYESFKKRFFSSSYILVITSLTEIIIIWRLFDQDVI